MNIGLFAAREVGAETAKVFGDNDQPLACLILDSHDKTGLNDLIIKSVGCPPNQIIYSNELYEDKTLMRLRLLNLGLALPAWWPYIIKDAIIRLPRIGCLNFHPSYLPYNRGKNYNFWTLAEDVPFGVTIHFVDKGIDTGDIAFQKLIEKNWQDTGETLYYKAQREIVQLFEDSFDSILSGRIPRKPQDVNQGSFHKSNELNAASQIVLDKNYKARDLLNLLRARTFRQHPAAWFVDGNYRYEVRIEIVKTGRVDEEEAQ